jgi:GTPase SAR1 family protein
MDTVWMKEQYEDRKQRVLSLLENTKDFFAKNNQPDQAQAFGTLHRLLEEGLFSIVVVGEFSAGKSTFLNALMGDKYLPSFTNETTATVNFLRHKSAGPDGYGSAIYYKDSNKAPDLSDSSARTIERFVSTKSDLQVVHEIDRVELFLESEFLSDGVMLIDSPGLNGVAEGHREVTERQIEKSHACIFMFSAEQPGRKTDFEFLTQLRSKVDTIILVLNKIDVVKASEQSVEDVVESLRTSYRKYFPDQPLPEIWPVAAYPALISRSNQALSYRGKENHSEEEMQHYLTISKMEAFEQRLWRFLVQGEKTRQQLYAPVDRVKKLLAARQEELNALKQDLSETQDTQLIELEMSELETEIRQIEEKLTEKKQELFEEINKIVKETKESLKSKTYTLKQRLMNDVNDWTDLDQVQMDVGSFNKRILRQYHQLAENVHQEFLDEFSELLRGRYKEYQHQIENEISAKHEGIEFKLSGKLEADSFDFHFGLDEYRNRKDSFERELDELEAQISAVTNERLQADELRSKKVELETKLDDTKQREFTYLAALGPRPGTDRHAEEFTERKWRGGLGGFFGNIFKGKKEVTRISYYTDDSARMDYDERVQKIEDQFDQEALELKLKMDMIGDSEKSPEQYRHALTQLEKINMKKRQERDQFEEEFKKEFQKKHAAVLRKVRNEIEDYIDGLEKDAEEGFIKQLRSQRNQLCDIAVDIIQSNLQHLIAQKQHQLDLRKQQLESSVEEKEAIIQRCDEEINEIHSLLIDAVSLATELEFAEVDTIGCH